VTAFADTAHDVAALVSVLANEPDPDAPDMVSLVDNLVTSIEQADPSDRITAFLRIASLLLFELATANDEDPQETWQRLAVRLTAQLTESD